MAGLILPEFEIVMGAEFKFGSRFQDADSDMVADTPSDPAKQVDPSTLIFAYTLVEDPAVT
jgi:phosphonate transport system substrate-binding protein